MGAAQIGSFGVPHRRPTVQVRVSEHNVRGHCQASVAHTTTIRLALGIVILPQRNPVVLAKQVATLDVLPRGRVILGIGVGYLEPEFRAVGANFAERGAVTDEYLDETRAMV